MDIKDHIKSVKKDLPTVKMLLHEERIRPLKKKGSVYFFKCHLNTSTNHSFIVGRDSYWHCRPCNKGGDVITLVADLKNISYFDAFAYLVEKFEIRLPIDLSDYIEGRVTSELMESEEDIFFSDISTIDILCKKEL